VVDAIRWSYIIAKHSTQMNDRTIDDGNVMKEEKRTGSPRDYPFSLGTHPSAAGLVFSGPSSAPPLLLQNPGN
jgi:nanoRNase/pAp phosphatase (c-di-AMP/oligoRNAs hydrolase)